MIASILAIAAVANFQTDTAPPSCGFVGANEGAAKLDWFQRGDPIAYDGKTFVKVGVPNQHLTGTLYMNVRRSPLHPAYADKIVIASGDSPRVLFVLVDREQCLFQAYRAS